MNKENLKNRDVISAKDFSREELEFIFDISKEVKEKPERFRNSLKDKIISMIFFEPSTRTYQSFQTSAKSLGSDVIGFAEPNSSSYGGKGESFHDTIRIFENYSDCIIIRHPAAGSAKFAAEISKKPVINAGSGFQEHPTQAMLDLFTIKSEFGEIDTLNIGLVGDLRYGRTIPSLCYALSKFDVQLNFIAPDTLQIRPEVEEFLASKSISFSKQSDLNKAINDLDVLYVTRLQKERFVDPTEYLKLKGSYRITLDNIKNVKEGMIILHPLPRVDEISSDIDNTKFAKYFEQARNGLFVRTALLNLILS
ncbi:MAG: aspartate carbamoyltransferase [Candidatus Aenigmarchaeota archaeon]|nr:aspartate carbamoyltransferase [Candidatus Aenigmarchaeota archaeon]